MFETISHRVLTVGGIQLRIDLTFYAVFLALVLGPLILGRDLPLRFLIPVCVSMGEFVLFLALAILIHESGHAIFAKLSKHEVDTIVLHGLGGWTHVSSMTEPPRISDIPMFLSGPAANLTAGCAFALVGVDEMASLNLTLGLANLAFAWPMDGGRVIEALIFSRVGSETRAFMLLRWVSRLGYLVLLLVFHDAITSFVLALFWLVSELALRPQKQKSEVQPDVAARIEGPAGCPPAP